MSVVLVIAVGLFFLRDNIAKFINNTATQITGEESRPEGMNEYGFYFDKAYVHEASGVGFIFHEDGSVDAIERGNITPVAPAGSISYSSGVANVPGNPFIFSSDGRTGTLSNRDTFVLKE